MKKYDVIFKNPVPASPTQTQGSVSNTCVLVSMAENINASRQDRDTVSDCKPGIKTIGTSW